MRVVVLISSLYTGGAEFSTLTFYGWLQKKGWDVKLICYKKASTCYDPTAFGLSDAVVLEGNNFWKKLGALKELIEEFKPLLIHSVLFEANILGRFCKFRYSGIVHLESLVNEMYSSYRLKDPNVNAFKLKGYQVFDFITQYFGVDHFHANGIAVARHYQRKLRISSKRMTVIPRGRTVNPFLEDTSLKSEMKKQFCISDHAVVLIQVARHEYQKAHIVLLQALKKVGSKYNFVCLLVGREGNLTAAIKREIEASGLQNNVKILGHRNDVAQLLAIADVFVFPSRFEGLPGALIEAEAGGLPIVCSDIANNREVAVEGENALFFPVDDVSKLSEALTLLICDAARRHTMGKKSLLIFEANFNLEKIHVRMKNLLESLVRI